MRETDQGGGEKQQCLEMMRARERARGERTSERERASESRRIHTYNE